MSPLERAAAARDSTAPPPLLVRPFDGAVTGFVVVFLAMAVEIVSGAFASRMSPAVTIPLLVGPVVVAYGVALLQWWQVRAAGADRPSWWHLGAVVAALILWYVLPREPQQLAPFQNAGSACLSLPIPAHTDCIPRAAQAFDNYTLVWWSAFGLILVGAMLARRSRIAAWAALPVALAGAILADNMLEQLLVHFNVSG